MKMNALKLRRLHLAISQEEAGAMIGVTRSTIKFLENGQRKGPSLVRYLELLVRLENELTRKVA